MCRCATLSANTRTCIEIKSSSLSEMSSSDSSSSSNSKAATEIETKTKQSNELALLFFLITTPKKNVYKYNRVELRRDLRHCPEKLVREKHEINLYFVPCLLSSRASCTCRIFAKFFIWRICDEKQIPISTYHYLFSWYFEVYAASVHRGHL